MDLPTFAPPVPTRHTRAVQPPTSGQAPSTRHYRRGCRWALALAGVCSAAQPAAAADVLGYHADATRSARYEVPGLTWARAQALRADARFQAHIQGSVYAQPLYWRDAGHGKLLIVTEDDDVYALDALTGHTLWQRSLGRPVPLADMPCGDIDPLGITGTPVIDSASHTLYLDAMRLDPAHGQPEHVLFGLSIDDGSTRPGWPVQLATRLPADGGFIARYQNQRGALALLDGWVYVPYGGNFGDCGRYHGWIVGVNTHDPRQLRSWHTAAWGGGIWAPGGIVADGRSLLFTTGNTMDSSTWQDGEAVIRLDESLRFSGSPADFFTPRDWQRLDARDQDLGSVAPMPFELAGHALLLALGKDRRAYLLDREHLGGIGGQLLARQVADAPIRTAPALYRVGDAIYAAFQGPGASCPQPQRGDDLTVLRIQGVTQALQTVWCAPLAGRGAPIVTTIDGTAQPIVWILGADGDRRLHAFRGDTGQPLFVSAALPGLRTFETLIASDDHLYVGADDNVFAFTFQ